jgi:hypothetical protein
MTNVTVFKLFELTLEVIGDEDTIYCPHERKPSRYILVQVR